MLINPREAGFNRDQCAEFLADHGIDTRKYFYPPVHQQDIFRRFIKRGQRLPVTDYIAENIISLPLYSHQKVAEIDRVAHTIKACSQKYGRQKQKTRQSG